MKIRKSQLGLITDTVNDLFYRAKARLLGKHFKGPSIYFEVAGEDPSLSIEDVYRYTMNLLYGSNAKIDPDEVKDMADIVGNYIDAERLKAINNVVASIQAARSLNEAEDAIQTVLDKSTTYLNMLAVTETTKAVAYAEKSGITQLAASIGVADPVICKYTRRDAKVCHNCQVLWTLSDGVTPRAYRMSELGDGWYNPKKGQNTPPIGATHPNCRCLMTFIPPGYGFDSAGTVKFIGFGYDVVADQRAAAKSERLYVEELFETLSKDCGC